MNPVRDDDATTTCPTCGVAFQPEGRQRHCSTRCRQRAWRRRRSAPVEPLVAPSDTVYACRSAKPATWASNAATTATPGAVGLVPVGCVPAVTSNCCSDLFDADQLASLPSATPRRR